MSKFFFFLHQLFYEKNYEWATVCFERANDKYWERMAKASGLKAMADLMRTSKPEEANSVLREAAEIFEAIEKAESAARCFADLGEYERAGIDFLTQICVSLSILINVPMTSWYSSWFFKADKV